MLPCFNSLRSRRFACPGLSDGIPSTCFRSAVPMRLLLARPPGWRVATRCFVDQMDAGHWIPPHRPHPFQCHFCVSGSETFWGVHCIVLKKRAFDGFWFEASGLCTNPIVLAWSLAAREVTALDYSNADNASILYHCMQAHSRYAVLISYCPARHCR